MINRSSTFSRLCVASVTFCLKLASDRMSRRALACGSLSSPYRTLKSPTMMMPMSRSSMLMQSSMSKVSSSCQKVSGSCQRLAVHGEG